MGITSWRWRNSSTNSHGYSWVILEKAAIIGVEVVLANRETQAKLKRMNSSSLNVIFAVFLWLTAFFCPNIAAFELSTAQKKPIDRFWVLEDSGNTLPDTDILRQPISNWTQHNTPTLNMGYTQSTVWIRFDLSNQSSQSINRILDITYPLLDSVTLYKLNDQQGLTKTMQSGDAYPFSQKNIKHPNHVELIYLTRQTSGTYFIKIKSNSPIQTQFIIWNTNEFQDHYRSVSGFNFFYLGLIFSIVIFNFFVFLFLKEPVYLTYSIYAAFFGLLMTSQNAILFEYLYPDHPLFHNWSQLLFAAGAISLTSLFNFFFLKMSPQSFGSKTLITFTIIPALLVIISPIIGFALSIQIIVISALIIVPTCFGIGIYYSKRRKDQKLYLLAWSWLIIGVTLFLLQKLGLIPFNILTNNSIQIGSALELITFSIALARRIHTEKETRIHAQQIIIESSKRTALLHKEMLYNATHHPITKLPNRVALEALIEETIGSFEEFKVIYIKLSRITEIDKTLGRKFSEEALKVFSSRLHKLTKDLDGIISIEKTPLVCVATLNSNTHSFIIKSSESERFTETLKLLIDKLNTPIEISEMEIEPYITASYSVYPEHGEDSISLLRHAGIAIDHANPGDQSIVRYRSEIDPYNERRLNMMSELNRAIFSDKLALHFQPLVDTHTEQILGAEALIRWPHEEYGLIMPDQFIQPAEQTGVIQALSLWVLRNAIKQQQQWIKINPSFLLSINISAFNLQDQNFIEAVHILFAEHEHLAKNIILEITESQMMTDTHHALKNLWELSELGFHIAIDDFGTGYSNLAYLKKLPASELKIDKTFILNLESDKQNQVLVQTAIHMAHNLGMKVVAEGVESEHSRKILSEMGCDMCQGFHFSRPIPAEQFNGLFKNKDKPLI